MKNNRNSLVSVALIWTEKQFLGGTLSGVVFIQESMCVCLHFCP